MNTSDFTDLKLEFEIPTHKKQRPKEKINQIDVLYTCIFLEFSDLNNL